MFQKQIDKPDLPGWLDLRSDHFDTKIIENFKIQKICQCIDLESARLLSHKIKNIFMVIVGQASSQNHLSIQDLINQVICTYIM